MRRVLLFATIVLAAAAMTVSAAAAPRRGVQEAFYAPLSGAQEVPPVQTAAQGAAIMTLSQDGSELHFQVIVAGLMNFTQAHIHVGERGVNGPVVVWLRPEGPPATLVPGFTNGILAEGVITDNDIVAVQGVESLADLLDVMRSEGAYVNVHTAQYPGGEIRGQIQPLGTRLAR